MHIIWCRSLGMCVCWLIFTRTQFIQCICKCEMTHYVCCWWFYVLHWPSACVRNWQTATTTSDNGKKIEFLSGFSVLQYIFHSQLFLCFRSETTNWEMKMMMLLQRRNLWLEFVVFFFVSCYEWFMNFYDFLLRLLILEKNKFYILCQGLVQLHLIVYESEVMLFLMFSTEIPNWTRANINAHAVFQFKWQAYILFIDAFCLRWKW